MALLFGLRGGIFAASLSGLLYVPHIAMSWASEPQYRAAQFIEIGMYIVIGSLTGVLADHERVQRRKVEETARKLSEVYAQLQSSFEQLRRVDRLSALGELFATKHNQIAGTQYRVEASIHGGKDEIDHPLPVIRQRIL